MGKKWAALGHSFLIRNKRISAAGKLEDMPTDVLAQLNKDTFPKKGISQHITSNILSYPDNIMPPDIVSTITGDVSHMIYIPAYVGHLTPSIPITILIDTGSSQANLICKAFAARLVDLGAITSRMSVTLSPGFGGNERMCEVTESMIEFVICFNNLNSTTINPNRIYTLRAVIVNDLDSSILIGYPAIQHYGFLDIVRAHMTTIPQIHDICYKEHESMPAPTILSTPQYIDNTFVSYNNLPSSLQDNIIHINNIISKMHINDIFTNEEDDDEVLIDDINDHIPPLNFDFGKYDPLVDITIEGSDSLRQRITNLCIE
jgi:hypothetical protein